MFYNVTANTELVPLGKHMARFLGTSGHISIDQSTHDLLYVCSCLKTLNSIRFVDLLTLNS